jgi:hypothetical protein
MPDRFSQVADGVYRGGRPSNRDLQILSDVYGVKRIISLDGDIGAEISSTCQQLGIDHVIIPIGGPESLEMVEFLKENIIALLELQPAYIHCKHGKDRTGMAVALYRIKAEGWDPTDALNEALSFDFGEGVDPETKSFYRGAFMGNEDVNESRDYRHPDYESAHDDLFPTPYQKPSNIMGDDIANNMRTQFNFGDVPPAFNPQQSFSVLDDVKYAPPGEEISNVPPEFRDPFHFMLSQELAQPSEEEKLKRKLRKQILQELSSQIAPNVGLYDNYDGIRGAGPLAGNEEHGGFVQDTERGATPGVGAVETGGFLNL